ncbi:MAG TPA: hypothetical protein VM554_12140 [Acidisarcina sp.]|nr:hypothetical protein [Acidisarcina sp.]
MDCARILLAAVLAAASLPACAQWEMQQSHTQADLRGIHAAGNGVAWASGNHGTVLRTEDGGYLWQVCSVPPGAETLDFRSIVAWDAQTAMVMSSGRGEESRLYKTTDGCVTWKPLYTNPDPKGFWDAIAFTSRKHGVILGDPVDGRFVIFRTEDGGLHWRRVDDPALAADPHGEGAFAASNSSYVAIPFTGKYTLDTPLGAALDFFGTSGPGGPRVFYLAMRDKESPAKNLSKNSARGSKTARAKTAEPKVSLRWMSAAVPMAKTAPSMGIFSLAFRDASSGVAVGGDYLQPGESSGTAAFTVDNGQTWTKAARPPHGYRSSVAWSAADNAWVAVGTNGADISRDDGNTWQPTVIAADGGPWNALGLPWVVGPKGRIAKLISLK